MKIDHVECHTLGESTRLSARLVWEESAREETLWYEWPASFAADVAPAPATALVAALPLALVTGERRVTMQAPICAFLYDHLRNALGLFTAWNPRLTAPALELEREAAAPAPVADRRAAVCLSGGVDSVAALVENHGALAAEHPERMRDGLYMFGLNSFDFEQGQPAPERVAWNRRYGSRLRDYCERVGVTLVPIATNVRSLHADWATWASVGQASALAAAAHGMPRRIHALTIAGGGTGAEGSIAGSEPSLDPLYSSYSLDVRTVHGTVSRLEKVRMIAHDADALSVLRVCLTFSVPPADGDALNCGACEKCVRTMLALVVFGALGRTSAFPTRDVTPRMVEGLMIEVTARRQVALYRSMVPMLRQCGRDDLAHSLTKRLDRLQREQSRRSRSLLQRVFRA